MAQPGMPLTIKTYSGPIAFDVNGDATVTYPGGAFSKAVREIAAVAIDAQGCRCNRFELVPWNARLGTCNLRCYDSDGAVISDASVSVYLRAIGV